MEIVKTIRELREWRGNLRGDLGLVPTMGFLHEGHLSLVRHALAQNPHAAVSIFVNPTQFAPDEDLDSYPRDLQRDVDLLKAKGCHLLFAPPPSEVYPEGFQTRVEVAELSKPLEGVRRPTHFQGVATVVMKLFGIFQPTRAYFGQKDAQQLALIRRMARDLNLPIQIVGCPIIREPDGLAMSSRNAYLTPAQRAAAPVLHRALLAARTLWLQGEKSAESLRRTMRQTIETEPLVRLDYATVADPETLAELGTAPQGALLALAAFLDKTRLIDNMVL